MFEQKIASTIRQGHELVFVLQNSGNDALPYGCKCIEALGGGPRESLFLDFLLEVTCSHVHGKRYIQVMAQVQFQVQSAETVTGRSET